MIFAKNLDVDRRLWLAIAFILISFCLVFIGADRVLANYLEGLGI